MLRLPVFQGGAAIACVVVALGGVAIAENLSSPETTGYDLRPALLCISLVLFSIVSYLAWPSRWNVLAHTQLVFSVVAYVIPIYFLHVLDYLPSEALDLYFVVATIGLAFAVVGVLVGRVLGSEQRANALRARFPIGKPGHSEVLARRVRLLTWASIIGIAVSFAVMGFIPAFTPDPLTAKFFRGAYAEPYAPVAPLYRASTSILAVLLPLVALYAIKRRELSWWFAVLGCLAVMLVGLQREPAVTGLLVLIGVALAARGRGLLLYFGILTAAYFAGGALYAILGNFGLGGFATTDATQSQVGFLAQVAGGAPDIRDHAKFLQSWLMYDPEPTYGRTFVGGLIPGNYQWNTSVWSLQVVNPGVPIERIASGGLRLPAPIWGLASFGWVGVAAVSFGYGFISGWISRLAARIIPNLSLSEALPWMVLYLATMEVLPNFFRLSYLSVGQLIIVAWLMYSLRPEPATHHHPSARPSVQVASAGGSRL